MKRLVSLVPSFETFPGAAANIASVPSVASMVASPLDDERNRRS
jgi:hypothetical protein